MTDAQKIWYGRNRDRLLKKFSDYRKANRGRQNARSRKYYHANKAKHAEYGKKARCRVINYYSRGKNACFECGFSKIDALCVDHINNDGASHRKSVGRGTRFYWWLIRNKFPLGFQVLRANCNLIKEIERRRRGRLECRV